MLCWVVSVPVTEEEFRRLTRISSAVGRLESLSIPRQALVPRRLAMPMPIGQADPTIANRLLLAALGVGWTILVAYSAAADSLLAVTAAG